MQLLKVSDGLIEIEDLNSTSPFPDFLGDGSTHLDNGKLYIDLNNKIERPFTYETFVIDIEKENWSSLTRKDYFRFFITANDKDYGVEDNLKNGQSTMQKIVYYDKYLQCYTSEDGVIWKNVGGLNIDGINKQGMKKYSEKTVNIKKYKVYKNPYLTIQNVEVGCTVGLYDENDNKIKERMADINRECLIFLDYCMLGYIKIFDGNGMILQSKAIEFQYGDVFCMTPYELELIYKGVVLTEEATTFNPQQDNFIEKVSLKNISAYDTYANLNLFTETTSGDTITLSLDNIAFTSNVVIDILNVGETKDIYIKVTKGSLNHGFKWRDFDLKINKVT